MIRRIHKPPVGSKPGTLAIDSEALQPVVRVTSYDEAQVEEHESVDADDIQELAGKRRNLWVDVQGLGDEALLRRLAEIFSIHPLALEDVVNAPVRPKAEPYEHNLLVVSLMLGTGNEDRLDAEQVSLLIGRDYVLTFQERHRDLLAPVRRRLDVNSSRIRRLSSDYLGYAILDTIIDTYYPVLEGMSDRAEQLEERVLVEPGPEILQEINSMKAHLLGMRRVTAPQREAVNSMIRGDYELISDTVRVFLRDTHDHIVQASEAVDQLRELVSGLMNTYLSVVSNRMNEVMKTLTIVASLFVPLTFLAGIYGMNFEHMPELGVRWAYPALLGVMGLVAVGMLFYFRSKGWMGRRD